MEVTNEPKVFFLTARRIMYWDRPPGEVLSNILLEANEIRYWGDQRDEVFPLALLMALRMYEELLGGVRGLPQRGERIPDFAFEMMPLWGERRRN